MSIAPEVSSHGDAAYSCHGHGCARCKHNGSVRSQRKSGSVPWPSQCLSSASSEIWGQGQGLASPHRKSQLILSRERTCANDLAARRDGKHILFKAYISISRVNGVRGDAQFFAGKGRLRSSLSFLWTLRNWNHTVLLPKPRMDSSLCACVVPLPVHGHLALLAPTHGAGNPPSALGTPRS